MNLTISYPHINIRARELFRKIYQNQKINPTGSKQTLKEQLDFYLDHLSFKLQKEIPVNERSRIFAIITRNNHVSEIINSKGFIEVTEGKKRLMGETALGLIYCIDGRIPAVFLGGRYAHHWEVPAAELKVKKRKSDSKLIPESSDLCEALRKIVTTEKDLLEIVFAHTSLLDSRHGCGAITVKRDKGQLDKKLSNEEANLKIIEDKTIPAITNLYNDFRQQKGFEPLIKVGISAIYDTDTFGIILNFDQKDSVLSTTNLTDKFKDQIEDLFIKDNLIFGSFREKFTYLKYLTPFSKNILKVTEALLKNPQFSVLTDFLNQYIENYYQDLTVAQKKALKFFICRTIAFQYLIGGCNIKKKNLSHPFAHHEEEYMAVSTRGTTIGKYDPQDQEFSSTPADTTSAINNIKTKLSIMGRNLHNKNRAYLLFICNPVNLHDLRENSVQLHKIMDANAELFRSIVDDTELGQMIEELKIILIPILIEEDTLEVLKIIDHSAYI